MKLKQYLREVVKMPYSEYKKLHEYDQYALVQDLNHYNHSMKIHDQNGWRQMTPEEKEKYEEIGEKERNHWNESCKIGGTEGCQYIRLSDRLENRFQENF